MCTFVIHLHVFLQLKCQLLYRLLHFPQPSCSHSDSEIDEEQKNTKGMENRDQKNNTQQRKTDRWLESAAGD